MHTTGHFVVTGATGFIGRHLVSRMLREPEANITLIVRGENAAKARDRALSCLRDVARDLAQPLDEALAERSIRVLVGDLTLPLCGVDLGLWSEGSRGGAVEFWHVAATLCFEESKAQRIHDQNVTGTLHALELARALGAARFVYVSTAYVCGSAIGEIPEALAAKNGPFSNEYERSKCLAEHLVHEWCSSADLDFKILRPSIVVGLSSSHAPSGSDSGLYGFVREAIRLRRVLVGSGERVRLLAERDAQLNFVPVDVLVNDMLSLRNDGFQAGTVFHLTSRHCPTVGETMDAICDALEMPRFCIVSRLDGDVSKLEALLARRIVFYGSYLRHAKTFTRSSGAAGSVDARDVARFVSSFLEVRAAEPLTQSVRRARDGFPLLSASLVRPGRQTVVLVNAMGMPLEALAKLERALTARFNVLTWESRGAPSLADSVAGERGSFARHVDDLEDLLRWHGVERASLVGWCTGADVALEFARRSPSRVLSLVCLNGPFLGLSRARSSYQSNLERIVRYGAKSEAHAAMYHGLISELLAGSPAPAAANAEARQVTAEALSAVDPEMRHVTAAPLRSVASFHRYCLLLQRYLDEAPRDVPQARLRALVVSAKDDAIAHSDASRDAAARLRAELRMYESGGHFAPCKSELVIRGVVDFVAGAAPVLVASERRRAGAGHVLQYSE